MIVIYHDVGGSHSSCTAANIHVNNIPMDNTPDKSTLLSLPTFDKLDKKDIGHLIYIGTDEFGAKVYTISRRYKPSLVLSAIMDLYSAMDTSDRGLYLVNTSPIVNLTMKIGGFSSRALGLVAFGRPIVTHGTLKAYNDISNLVKLTKNSIKNDLNRKN